MRYFHTEAGDAKEFVDSLKNYNDRHDNIYRDIKIIDTSRIGQESDRAAKTTRADDKTGETGETFTVHCKFCGHSQQWTFTPNDECPDMETVFLHGYAYECERCKCDVDVSEALEDAPVTNTEASRTPASPGTPGRLPPDQQSKVGRSGYSLRDVQAEITDTIVAAIESGRDNGTFQMPWQAVASEGLPVNAVTEKPYHGVNVLVLSLTAMQRKWPNQWASFQQWKEGLDPTFVSPAANLTVKLCHDMDIRHRRDDGIPF